MALRLAMHRTGHRDPANLSGHSTRRPGPRCPGSADPAVRGPRPGGGPAAVVGARGVFPATADTRNNARSAPGVTHPAAAPGSFIRTSSATYRLPRPASGV
ncbi:hypothetical protein Sxan_19070 [Streptomyces xanthophaeus]|uniref:Uncharacterized protein n=1 Tax=Streptomyces xanthophaeus TaxID=67385 RepID=A0A919L9X1_9ACTN|nr:hypothetical protein Sxan_19070 [Streptomyces xanthophaeus]